MKKNLNWVSISIYLVEHIHLKQSPVCSLYKQTDWLILCSFTSRSRIFHLYGDVSSTGEELQSLGPCSALSALEQGGIFIMPHLLWHGTSVLPVSSEEPLHLIAYYDLQGDAEELFLPGSSLVYNQTEFLASY
jgi:hypothetical protein